METITVTVDNIRVESLNAVKATMMEVGETNTSNTNAVRWAVNSFNRIHRFSPPEQGGKKRKGLNDN